MSFTGDLQHLPVVDIIQLLHSTRRSGTLRLNGPKGESQLGFSDGYIVSANHLNNSVRIGQVLVEMKALSQDDLEQTLQAQKAAGAARQPLIATLIESGKITKDAAFKGLEVLIEMTIVEVLTWESGTFSLDVDLVTVSDEYRYFPETLKQDFYVSTQNVLMDALRIFDERMRDGMLDNEVFTDTPAEEDSPTPSVQVTEESSISADLLGLDELDQMEKKIPDVFKGLRQVDPAEIHKKIVLPLVADLPGADQERLISYLLQLQYPDKNGPTEGGDSLRAIIVFSRDELLKYVLTAVCKHHGYIAFTTDDEASLDLIIAQSLAKQLPPRLIIDLPLSGESKFSSDRLTTLRRLKLANHPTLDILQLAAPHDTSFMLAALHDGVRAVFPKPPRDNPANYGELFIACVEALRAYLAKSGPAANQTFQPAEWIGTFNELAGVREAPEVSGVLLRQATRYYERALTLIVAKGELIAERNIGIRAGKQEGPSTALKFKIPLHDSSLLNDVVESGKIYCGVGSDSLLDTCLYPEIGAPRHSHILLLPLRANNRTLALIYADFGVKSLGDEPLEVLETCARLAGVVLENALYRKTFEKSV